MKALDWRLWLALGAGIILWLALLYASLIWNQKQQQHQFQAARQADVHLINSQLQQAESAISSLATLFIADPYVDADQFRLLSNALFERHPFLKTSIYAPRVNIKERLDYEAMIRQEGYPWFRIVSDHDSGSIYPIRYLEPFSPLSLKAIGTDLRGKDYFPDVIEQLIPDSTLLTSRHAAAQAPEKHWWLLKPLYSIRGEPLKTSHSNQNRGIVGLSIDFEKVFSHIDTGLVKMDFLLQADVSGNTPPEVNHEPDYSPFTLSSHFDIPFASRQLHLAFHRKVLLTILLSPATGAAFVLGLFIVAIFIVLARHATARRLAEQKLLQSHTKLEHRVHQRTQELKRSNELLQCIDQLREQFIKENDPFILFPQLMEQLLQLTDSQYGLIGDVLKDDDGQLYLKAFALSNLAWDEETNKLYNDYKNIGFEFHKLDNLFGHVVTSGQPVISNTPSKDPRGAGFPKGHPPISSFLGIPIYFGTQLVGEIGLANRDDGYNDELLNELSPVVKALGQIIVARWDQQARKEAETELQRLATTDPLTDIANRRQFDNQLRALIALGKRYHEELAVMMIDIDHFKQINDEYGHDIGDRILIELVRQLKKQVREPDLLARWGGEEFIILLPHTNADTASRMAERIRLLIAEHHFNKPEHLTISIGVTSLMAEDSAKSLVVRSDRALYQAKRSGRNCVVII